MSGLRLPGGEGSWSGGEVVGADGVRVCCVLAPNASPMTLDGTNTWIIPSGQEALVIDPGPDDPIHHRAVDVKLAELEVRATGILLTHAHPDHAAGAGSCAKSWGVPIHAFADLPVTSSVHVACGDLAVEVLATPGHTADSVCVRLAQGRLMLTGDTVLGRGTSVVAWPDGDLGAYLASLARLADCAEQVDYLLPGHGPVLAQPADVLSAYRAHRLRRLSEVKDALASGARTPAEVVAEVYADVPREVWPAAEQSVRAQLAYLGVL